MRTLLHGVNFLLLFMTANTLENHFTQMSGVGKKKKRPDEDKTISSVL